MLRGLAILFCRGFIRLMHLYFMGICGTAMGNAALMLRALGHTVCGADTGIYPPMSTLLQDSGITLYDGYDADRLEQIAPDLVVVGNVVSRGHPEMEWLLETRQFRYTSLPGLLSEQVLARRRNFVVAGTHGKTTTSTLAAYLLNAQSDKSPGYLIGGVPLDLPGGAKAGEDAGPFVIEGDEYDSAFFDKRSKFIHYLPHVLALNNLEFDHADIFRDLEDIKRTFRHVIRLVPRNGHILVNGEDENLASLFPINWTQVHSVGLSESCALRLVDFEEDPDGSAFTLLWQNQEWGRVRWKLAGEFNARNAAMAALGVGLLLHADDPRELSLDALSDFRGVKRRQEILFKNKHQLVLEDFGHHPSALRETLTSLRRRFPQRRIVACFEPRSNTARSRVFQHDLVDAFDHANAVFFGAVHRAQAMSADVRLDTAELCAALKNKHPGIIAEAFETNAALLESLSQESRKHENKPSITVFFSNGSFDGIMSRYTAGL